MVNRTRRFFPICTGALFFISAAHAKDLAAYHIGDTADEDLTASVPLDVIDPDATDARKTEEALQTPAIFRSYPDVTNEVETEFLAAFAGARAGFSNDVKKAAEQWVLDGRTNAPPDIAKLTAAFNAKNKILPISPALAGLWARGDSGLAVQTTLVERLREAMRRPIRADELPAGFAIGETVRLVPSGNADENVTLNDAEQRGKIATSASLATLSRARAVLLNAFPADEQSTARAMAAFLKPDCALDENLTQQSRARQIGRLAVTAHYDAGQMIVRRGETIDAKAKAALDQLNDKILPGQLNRQIAAERDRAQQEQEQAQREHEQAQREHEQAQREHEQAQQAENLAQQEHQRALKVQDQAAAGAQNLALKIHRRDEWLLAALAGISAVTLLMFWKTARRRRQISLLPVRAENFPAQNQAAIPAHFAPQLTQILKEAVVQGLAAQRGELLKAQQAAAEEIAGLVRRLDELKSPMQERLRAYEMQIQKLEAALAERNEENRELLKLKIEMTRRQLETERAQNRAGFN